MLHLHVSNKSFSVKETETLEQNAPSVIKREHSTVGNIKAAIMRHGNPFATESHTLFNLITHAYVLEVYTANSNS